MFIFQDTFEALKAEISEPNFWRNIAHHGSLVGFFFIVSWFWSVYATITETTGQTTFIIGMYVIFVPVVESALYLFVKCPPRRTWLSTLLVFVGVFFLSDCATENCFEDYRRIGVLYALMSMFAIVGQIITTSRALEVVSATPLVFATFSFGFVFVFILALIFESDFYTTSGWRAIFSAWRIIVLDASFDYFGSLFMANGMSHLTPERATILLSLDSLSGAFFGWVILGEVIK
jgi:drug/metabolite transporter (DMT)-like permease